MRKRWRWAVAGPTGLALVAFAAFVLWPRPDRVTRENFNLLRVGMSRAEVEAILGPSGDYRTGPPSCVSGSCGLIWDSSYPYNSFPTLDDWDIAATDVEEQGGSSEEWESNVASVRVVYHQSGSMVAASYLPIFVREGPFLDNVLWRVKRQWRRWFPDR